MALLPLTSEPDLVERVHRALLDAISDGSLAPGQRLTQEELAAQFAVSRQPVLQALRLLKAEGFVLDAPGRGVQVAPLDARWMGQVYQVRSALDAMAARLAARRGRGRGLRPTVLAPELLAAGRDAMARGSLREQIDADFAFHQAIYHAADNPLIEHSAALHWAHVRRAMGVRLQSASPRDRVWDEHEAIARAINAGDADRAAALALGHGERASEHIAHHLAQALTSPTSAA